jgi:uncharacterized protein (DUF849 family)
MRLPLIMIAPNGARHGKDKHPNIPLTVDELIETTIACEKQGAGGLHLHLRDSDGKHILDAGLYREAVQALSVAMPEMMIQVTTEAVGIYESTYQQSIALQSEALFVSVSIREILAGDSFENAARFYQRCHDSGITVQHILYDTQDFINLKKCLPTALFTATELQLLYVLGRYTANQVSSPEDIMPFLEQGRTFGISPDWAVCAFGQRETDCLKAAYKLNGKMRIGFENSFLHGDGTQARDNAERVSYLVKALDIQ